MSRGNATGARNVYSGGVRIGNWFEDSKGAELASRIFTAASPKCGTSEYRATMSVVHPVCAAGAAPKPIDTLDGHLLVAHGASVSEIAARRDPATRFLTMSTAAMRGTSVADTLAGRTESPRAAVRTAGIHEKACTRAIGHDPRDAAAPRIPGYMKTVETRVPVGEGMAIAPAAGAYDSVRTVASDALAAAATLAPCAADVRPAEGHGRRYAFTREFSGGIGGLRASTGATPPRRSAGATGGAGRV